MKIDLGVGEIQSIIYALGQWISNQDFYEKNILNYTNDSGNLANAKTAYEKLWSYS